MTVLFLTTGGLFLAMNRHASAQCSLRADLNRDGHRDALDVGAFIDCFLDGSAQGAGCNCADMNGDGLTDLDDLELFVPTLLYQPVLEDLVLISPTLDTSALVADVNEVSIAVAVIGRVNQPHTITWTCDNPNVIITPDVTEVWFTEQGEVHFLTLTVVGGEDEEVELEGEVEGPAWNGIIGKVIGIVLNLTWDCHIEYTRKTTNPVTTRTGKIDQDTFSSTETNENNYAPGSRRVKKTADGDLEVKLNGATTLSTTVYKCPNNPCGVTKLCNQDVPPPADNDGDGKKTGTISCPCQ